MSVIKYKAFFKRILTVTGTQNGRPTTMRVGEVTKFKMNVDGTLDIVAWIWPQTPKNVVEQIEKNPGVMGMTAENQQVSEHVIFPDGTQVEEVNTCEHEFVSTYKMDGEANKTRICVKCLHHT